MRGCVCWEGSVYVAVHVAAYLGVSVCSHVFRKQPGQEACWAQWVSSCQCARISPRRVGPWGSRWGRGAVWSSGVTIVRAGPNPQGVTFHAGPLSPLCTCLRLPEVPVGSVEGRLVVAQGEGGLRPRRPGRRPAPQSWPVATDKSGVTITRSSVLGRTAGGVDGLEEGGSLPPEMFKQQCLKHMLDGFAEPGVRCPEPSGLM